MNRLLQSPQQLSALIKAARKAHGFTQAKVASRLGVSQNRFSELERDASGLSVERLLELAKALGLELFVQKSGARSDPSSGPSAPDW
jgi:HTH-type transcriptional regulator / antitoxin HipB